MAEPQASARPGTVPTPDPEPLLAKEAGGRFQTLADHTRSALVCLRRIVQRPSIQAKAAWLGVGADQLARSAFLAVAFHDAGKASRLFQNNLRAGRRTVAFPHPLASALILLRVAGDGAHLWPAWRYPVVEALAVLAHHTELHAGLYRSVRPEARPDLDIPRLAAFIGRMRFWWADLGFDPWGDPPALDNAWPERLQQLERVRPQDVLARLQQLAAQVAHSERPRLKATYTLLLAALEEADHAASRAFEADQDPEEGLPVRDPAAVAQMVKEKIRAETSPSSLRPFQQEAEAAGAGFTLQQGSRARRSLSGADGPAAGCLPTGEQVVMAVPCGRGKTNAALLWWASLAERGRVDRLVWAMPTQVTSNTLYDRLTNRVVGPELVGLYHGHSLLERARRAASTPARQAAEASAAWDDLVRLMDGADEEAPLQTDPEALRSENRLGEWLARLMTVTTVDHLLYAFCHGFGKADYALGHLQTAAVVFDEVHYYDPQMLAHLREAFRLLRSMGIPHLLMSGTLPDSLLTQLGIKATRGGATAESPTYLLIEDPEGEGYRPFHLRQRSDPLLVQAVQEGEPGPRWELHPEAVELLEEGRRQGWTQLVVVNTVRRAQDAYLDLKARWGEEKVGLLHSRFAYQDRRALEERLIRRLQNNEPGLVVVATQVVEVSLDLSVRRMLTELAPLDALGQRAGRTNRGASEPDNGEVWVWLSGNGLPYQRGPLGFDSPASDGLLERSWQLLPLGTPTLGSWRQLCDEVYRARSLGPSNLPELFHECTLFGHNPKTIRFDEEQGRVFRPRAILQPTVNVVARDLLDELGDEAYDELWHVPVPQWWVLRAMTERTGQFFVHHYRNKPFLLCTLPYHHDLGFYERTGSEEAGAIIDLE